MFPGCTVTAPANGALGTCKDKQSPGSSCQLTCNEGYMYAVSGKTTCSLDNKLTAAKCPATSCKVEAPANGMAGDCPAFLASSKSCTPTCKEGFSASGPTHCDMGKLTATSICKEAGCTGIVAPVNGGLGTCTAEMDSCTTCEFTCNEGYARSG